MEIERIRNSAAPTVDRHAQLVKTAERVISQTFFGTLLKQMRESPFKSDLFSGGRGGQAFAALYDQQMADRMGASAGRKLAEAIARRFERKPAFEQHDAPAARLGELRA